MRKRCQWTRGRGAVEMAGHNNLPAVSSPDIESTGRFTDDFVPSSAFGDGSKKGLKVTGYIR
jgi:hypothetical protein